MLCPNCKTELPDGVRFCSMCGSQIAPSSMPDTGSNMNIGTESETTDPGSKAGAESQPSENGLSLHSEQDSTGGEGSSANTATYDAANTGTQNDEDSKRVDQYLQAKAFRESKMFKALIIGFGVAVFWTVIMSSIHKVPAALLAFLQAALFAVSWLMGMQIIKIQAIEKYKKYVGILLAIVGLVLVIPVFRSSFGDDTSSIGNSSSYDWNLMILGENIPKPNSKKMEIETNTEKRLSFTIPKASQQDYFKYVADCKSMGYTIEPQEGSDMYLAYNEQGFCLKVDFTDYSDEIEVILSAPVKASAIAWSNYEISKILPAPPSDKGVINEDMNGETKETNVVITGVSGEDYSRYVAQCKDKGFVSEAKEDSTSYQAYNETGHLLTLSYVSGDHTIHIGLENPMHFSSFSLPSSGLAALLPEPPTSVGKSINEYDWTYSAYLGEMTLEDFDSYVEDLKNAGFDKDITNYGARGYFSADYSPDDDISVMLEYIGNHVVMVDVDGSLNGDYSGYRRTESGVENLKPAAETSESSEEEEKTGTSETAEKELSSIIDNIISKDSDDEEKKTDENTGANESITGDLPGGVYVAGEDIPAGDYKLIYKTELSESDYWSFDYLYLIRSGSEGTSQTLGGTQFDERVGSVDYEDAKTGKDFHMNLKKGDKISVESEKGDWSYEANVQQNDIKPIENTGKSLSGGTYVAGEDFEAGRYLLIYKTNQSETDYWPVDYLYIIRSGSEGTSQTLGGTVFDERFGSVDYPYASAGKKFYLNLKPGDKITVETSHGKWTY